MLDPIDNLKTRLKKYRQLKQVVDALNGLSRLAVHAKLREIADHLLMEIIINEAMLTQKSASELLKHQHPIMVKEMKELRQEVVDFVKELRQEVVDFVKDLD